MSIFRILLTAGLLCAGTAVSAFRYEAAESLLTDDWAAVDPAAAGLPAAERSVADSVPAQRLVAGSVAIERPAVDSPRVGAPGTDSLSTAQTAVGASSADMPYLVADPMPTFRGGDIGAFCRWVQERVVYPDEAIAYGIEGRVTLGFIVERDGSVSEIEPLSSPDPVLSDAVVGVVRQSPRWKPGMIEGEPVRVRLSVPVEFDLKIDTMQTPARDATVPAFLGGDLISFKRWVLWNLDLPETIFNFGDEGWVDAEFAVSRKGKVRKVETPWFSDPDFADRIIRTISASPLWMPGSKSGDVFFQLRFDLLLERGEKGLYTRDNTVYSQADILPRFRGGSPSAFREWVYAKVDSLLGPSVSAPPIRIAVRFDVERDGTVTGIRVGQPQGHEAFSKIVRRALDDVPLWSPAELAGEKVRFRVAQLLDFSRSRNSAADGYGPEP